MPEIVPAPKRLINRIIRIDDAPFSQAPEDCAVLAEPYYACRQDATTLDATLMAALLDIRIIELGIGFGAAIMLSVGPNSLMLIREGLAQGRVITVATTVWMSESAILLSAFLSSNVPQWVGPSTRVWLSWCGLGALTWFAAGALRSALSNKALGTDRHVEALHTCLKRVLAVVWCNPLTYLELFLIPAAYCTTLTSPYERFEFIGAVMIMRAVACYGYALSGNVFGMLVSNRRIVRLFDAVSGLLLTGSAVALAFALTTSN